VLRARRLDAAPLARAQPLEPAFDLRAEPGRAERPPDRGLLGQPLEHGVVEAIDRHRFVDAERCRRGVGAEAKAVPDLVLGSFGRQTRVERPLLSSSSQAPGSGKPVRWWKSLPCRYGWSLSPLRCRSGAVGSRATPPPACRIASAIRARLRAKGRGSMNGL
jgi:hypothetical protein